jgi:hypothetical protein
MGDYAELPAEGVPERPKPDDMEKFSYWFDNFFATNPMAKMYVLCVVNVVFMVFFAVCFHLAGSQGGDWSENFWMGFTFAADMAEDDHGGPFPYWKQWMFRMMNFTFSFGGAFVFGIVINFLSSAIDDRVSGLRKGKSKVIESGHSLILGWNDRILSLVEQLCQANESEGGLPIVILAPQEKEGMDEYFMDALDAEARRGSKIVTRGGSPIEVSALLKVAVQYARSIVVLSMGDDPDEADAQSVRVTLALTGALSKIGKAPSCHIVLELQDVDNADVAMLGVVAPMVPEDTVIPVVAHDLMGKLMIQCAREIGLSKCFAGLICFDGSECYFSAWNSGEGHYDDGMTGKTFMDACYRFFDAAVIGVKFANLDDPKVAEAQGITPGSGEAIRPVMLNPSGDYVMQYGDKILVLAEDNDTYQYGPSNDPIKTPVPEHKLPPTVPEKILLCGWRRDFDDLITVLDSWVPHGSTVTLFNSKDEESMKVELQRGGLEWDAASNCPKMENITAFEYITGDPCSGKHLERLGPKQNEGEPEDRMMSGGVPSQYRVENYDSILMLSEEGKAAGMSADSRVMVSMLIMRHLQDVRGVQSRILVTEIRDPRTQKLMGLTQCSDSVVGNELVAMILAQISEDRDIGYVMEDLFSEAGNEMHIKDVRLFVAPDELLCWWDLVGRCMQRNMLPIGWIRKGGDATAEPVAIINPSPENGYDKNERMRWHGAIQPEGDLLIVISLD